ncbi:replicative DNA helicase [Neobacillus sedimentimangrovi]|uniref:replicative DNA helicase n=1 Tax=Neobacillus sedimentimangrovi TaxID=2699460 RepID=UPI001F374996|nr:replicative DNA helicase [Neobacillus sedimentimangrovi]
MNVMQSFEPYNEQAEEALVGAFFLDEQLIKECTIKPEQLYSSRLRQIFSAIRSLDEKGKPIDIISIIEELGLDRLQEIGGVSYLNQLAGSVPTTANFHFYEKLVKEYDRKRKTIHIAEKMMDQAWWGEIGQTLKEGIHDLMAIQDEETVDDDGNIQQSLVNLYEYCEQDHGEMVGIPSGFSDLDKITGGFRDSDLVIIGARPSMGKTAFALNLAVQAAVKDVSVIFSLEMPKIQLLKRMAGFIGKIDSLKMQNPRKEFQEEDWDRFSTAIGDLSNRNLHIFDKAGMDVPYIWTKVRKLRREYGEQKRMLVVIDYLQLIEGDRKFHKTREAEISEISRALKTMARELKITVIALSQLSRGVESRKDKRPILSDLRESGQIEQDADLIAFLYRDDYYSNQSSKKNRIELILAKHRNGPIGTIELGFRKEYGLFLNL